MLEKLMRYVNNWFEMDKHYGEFVVLDGALNLDDLIQQGQYIRIVGSIFNDGVYKYDENLFLIDETFTGQIWGLAIPKAFIELADSIEAWTAKYEEAAMTPYDSESFGGYSYSKSGGYAGEEAPKSTWQYMFKSELNRWRKI